jgi:hypothetical protein
VSKIGLRWKTIDVGIKGKLPESQRIQALNVEVNARHRWDTQQTMINHFSRNMQPKWIKIYEDHIWTNKLHTQQFKLEFKTQHKMTASQITEYEDIRNQPNGIWL